MSGILRGQIGRIVIDLTGNWMLWDNGCVQTETQYPLKAVAGDVPVVSLPQNEYRGGKSYQINNTLPCALSGQIISDENRGPSFPLLVFRVRRSRSTEGTRARDADHFLYCYLAEIKLNSSLLSFLCCFSTLHRITFNFDIQCVISASSRVEKEELPSPDQDFLSLSGHSPECHRNDRHRSGSQAGVTFSK
jgi:hypothetical protein